jgi:phosphodiesterase/alkaline phosphatase D-like protein
MPAVLTQPVSRRQLLQAGAAAGGALALGPLGRAPAFAIDRPRLTHGVQSGEPTRSSRVIWARADRPSHMRVQVSPTDSFKRAVTIDGPRLTADADYTGQLRLRGLKPGRDVFYRVQLEDAGNPSARSEPVVGHVRTAPPAARDLSCVWSGDLVGQGWGINPDAGAFGPNQLDATFGPQAAFVSAPPRANTSPAEGYQFFGEIAIAGETGALTARLRDIDGKVLYPVELAADEVPAAP